MVLAALTLAQTPTHSGFTCKQQFAEWFYTNRTLDTQNTLIHRFYDVSRTELEFRNHLNKLLAELNCPEINYSVVIENNYFKVTTALHENPWAIENPLNFHHFILLIRWAFNLTELNQYSHCSSLPIFRDNPCLLKTFDRNFKLPTAFYKHIRGHRYYRFSLGCLSALTRDLIIYQVKKQFDIP